MTGSGEMRTAGEPTDWNTREQVIHSARYYAKRHADMQHTEPCGLSLQLFDELFELHELQSRDRRC